MKTSLITVDRNNDPTYYIGMGIGFEYDEYGSFFGIIIAFLYWTIRIGIDRSLE